MTKRELENIRERADAKLRYARISLDELRALPVLDGGDFDRAHRESFLYHLVGAKEAFVGELNVYYQCGLPADGVSLGKLWKELQGQGRDSPEQCELYQLESDATSWLSVAKEMRDYSTHVAAVARIVNKRVPGESSESLRKPKTGQEVPGPFLDVFADWLRQMQSMLERLRSTAIKANKEGEMGNAVGKPLKFKQIAVASTASGPVLYGLTDDGKVYQFGGEHTGWVAVRMDLITQ